MNCILNNDYYFNQSKETIDYILNNILEKNYKTYMIYSTLANSTTNTICQINYLLLNTFNNKIYEPHLYHIKHIKYNKYHWLLCKILMSYIYLLVLLILSYKLLIYINNSLYSSNDYYKGAPLDISRYTYEDDVDDSSESDHDNDDDDNKSLDTHKDVNDENNNSEDIWDVSSLSEEEKEDN